MGLVVEERDLNIDEVIEAHKAGTLREVFGTGTAATISLIKELRYKDYVMEFDIENWVIAPKVKDILNGIRYGKTVDSFGWMLKL